MATKRRKKTQKEGAEETATKDRKGRKDEGRLHFFRSFVIFEFFCGHSCIFLARDKALAQSSNPEQRSYTNCTNLLGVTRIDTN
jgi:hypothetical protein